MSDKRWSLVLPTPSYSKIIIKKKSCYYLAYNSDKFARLTSKYFSNLFIKCIEKQGRLTKCLLSAPPAIK